MDRIDTVWWSPNSLKLKLIIGALVLTVPLITVLLVGSRYAIGTVRTQVSDSYKNLTTLYMRQIDDELNKVDNYLTGLVSSGMELATLNRTNNSTEYFQAKILLFNEFRNNLVLYPAISAFFMYDPGRSGFMPVLKDSGDYSQIIKFQRHIESLVGNMPEHNGYYQSSWRAHEVGGEYYIVHILKEGNIYFGSWEKAERLMIPLNFIRFGAEGGSLFVSASGEAMTNARLAQDASVSLLPGEDSYHLTGEDKKFLVVGEASRKGDFSLVAVIPDEQILGNLPYFQLFAAIAPFAAIFVVLVSLVFLRRIVLVPMNRLLLAMKRIREGNLNVRIDNLAVSDEFRAVNQTFNDMMGQIQELTVNVYEEKLSKQREELQRLQLQINPHFFLNALNIVYHLAKVKDYHLIKEMAQSLIRYFRFMFRSNLTFVSVKEELEHTINYLRIQELRFPGQLGCTYDVPDYVREEWVPPLVIHTFVENTIKHAVTLDNSIQLSIRADIVERNGQPFVQLMIEDTGAGFPEHVLRELQSNRSLATEQGEHIGIWNVQRRLKLLYGDDAFITFSNKQPHGAAVAIWLPCRSVQPNNGREGESDV